MDMLYEGALLAVLVVWFFLRDWRATLVAATALPLSILPTFAAMAWLGFSLDILTLLALAIVVGILVDEIGRASCRERVCQYVYISVVAVSFKKKKNTNTY